MSVPVAWYMSEIRANWVHLGSHCKINESLKFLRTEDDRDIGEGVRTGEVVESVRLNLL